MSDLPSNDTSLSTEWSISHDGLVLLCHVEVDKLQYRNRIPIWKFYPTFHEVPSYNTLLAHL